MAQTKEGACKVAAAYYKLSLEEYKERLKTQSYCNGCKQWKMRDDFGKDGSRNNGLKKRCFSCVKVKEPKKSRGMLGRRHSEESKAKMRKPRFGVKNLHRIGAKHSPATRLKISRSLRKVARRGDQCHNWKGGVTAGNVKARQCAEYKEWRRLVYERDSYTCQHCGDKRGGNLHAHHKKGFADYPDLRYDVDNGLTLCTSCHSKVHDRPFSTRKLRRHREKTIGIRGFYKLSDRGMIWHHNKTIPRIKDEKDGNPIIKCGCGCGQEFHYYDSSGRARLFASGHNFQSSPTKDRIIDLLTEKPMRVQEIAESTGKSARVISVAVSQMFKKGLLERIKRD